MQSLKNSKITSDGARSLIPLSVKGMSLLNFELYMPAWNLLFWLNNGLLAIRFVLY